MSTTGYWRNVVNTCGGVLAGAVTMFCVWQYMDADRRDAERARQAAATHQIDSLVRVNRTLSDSVIVLNTQLTECRTKRCPTAKPAARKTQPRKTQPRKTTPPKKPQPTPRPVPQPVNNNVQSNTAINVHGNNNTVIVNAAAGRDTVIIRDNTRPTPKKDTSKTEFHSFCIEFVARRCR